jgi:hypothetical protein
MVITAVSCAKEVVDTKENNNLPIDFSTLLTRGSTIFGAQDVAALGGFRVWGYAHLNNWVLASTKEPLFSSTLVTSPNNGVTWSYGTPVNWPEGQKVSFFACAPAGVSTITANGVDVPKIDFTIDPNVVNQIDLLVAREMFDLVGPNPVNVVFDHALSRIRFSALKYPDFDGKVVITSIKLTNLYFKGATLFCPPAWNVDNSSVTDYTVSVSSGTLENLPLTTSEQYISSSTGTLFLMPQTLIRASGTPQMIVTFTVGDQEMSFTCPLSLPDEWVTGKPYTYQLLIDGETVRVIVIDTDVWLTDWEHERVMQTVVLGINQNKNTGALYAAVRSFNTLIGNGDHNDCSLFTIYAANNLTHSLTIDMSDPGVIVNNFDAGTTLVFDFETILGSWGSGVSVTVDNYLSGWSLGAGSSASLSGKGKIILIKN